MGLKALWGGMVVEVKGQREIIYSSMSRKKEPGSIFRKENYLNLNQE